MTELHEGKELALTPESTIAQLTSAEFDVQIATAKRYPRSIKRFVDEATQMVAMNESIAAACIYALPRDGKTVEGPSARFAEIVASAWGNCRAGARVVNESADFITAQGVFHDLERNVAITFEVQRRITDKQGKRYKPDMIGVTGNAASSIALRNAILKGIPKAFWETMYERARQVVRGDFQTLANRRAAALHAFQGFGVTPEQVFSLLEVKGIDDITLDHLVTLRGVLTAIKEGDTTPEQAFAPRQDATSPAIAMPGKKSAKNSVPPAGEATNEAPTSAPPPDSQPSEPPSEAAAPPAGEAGGTEPQPLKPISATQRKIIESKMHAAGKSTDDLAEKFGLGLDEITSADYRSVVNWLDGE